MSAAEAACMDTDVTLRVTAGGVVTSYKLDRWD